jgi:hypothetical protein
LASKNGSVAILTAALQEEISRKKPLVDCRVSEEIEQLAYGVLVQQSHLGEMIRNLKHYQRDISADKPTEISQTELSIAYVRL